MLIANRAFVEQGSNGAHQSTKYLAHARRGAAIGAAARSVTAFSLLESGSSDQPTAASEWIHLDKNENPYGPAQRVSTAMQSGLRVANRFPELELNSLVDSIAQFHRVRREQVTLGCGSTDILRMCCGAFLGSGKKMAMATPGFEPMARFARESGADVQVVPLTKIARARSWRYGATNRGRTRTDLCLQPA